MLYTAAFHVLCFLDDYQRIISHCFGMLITLAMLYHLVFQGIDPVVIFIALFFISIGAIKATYTAMDLILLWAANHYNKLVKHLPHDPQQPELPLTTHVVTAYHLPEDIGSHKSNRNSIDTAL
jgi:hypothetical protein